MNKQTNETFKPSTADQTQTITKKILYKDNYYKLPHQIRQFNRF